LVEVERQDLKDLFQDSKGGAVLGLGLLGFGFGFRVSGFGFQIYQTWWTFFKIESEAPFRA
jgi:hypothetical protein